MLPSDEVTSSLKVQNEVFLLWIIAEQTVLSVSKFESPQPASCVSVVASALSRSLGTCVQHTHTHTHMHMHTPHQRNAPKHTHAHIAPLWLICQSMPPIHCAVPPPHAQSLWIETRAWNIGVLLLFCFLGGGGGVESVYSQHFTWRTCRAEYTLAADARWHCQRRPVSFRFTARGGPWWQLGKRKHNHEYLTCHFSICGLK